MNFSMRVKVKTDRHGGFCGRVALTPSNYIFALTSMSLRMIVGFVKIVFSKG